MLTPKEIALKFIGVWHGIITGLQHISNSSLIFVVCMHSDIPPAPSQASVSFKQNTCPELELTSAPSRSKPKCFHRTFLPFSVRAQTPHLISHLLMNRTLFKSLYYPICQGIKLDVMRLQYHDVMKAITHCRERWAIHQHLPICYIWRQRAEWGGNRRLPPPSAPAAGG